MTARDAQPEAWWLDWLRFAVLAEEFAVAGPRTRSYRCLRCEVAGATGVNEVFACWLCEGSDALVEE